MIGYESQASGGGGLAAQAQPDTYFTAPFAGGGPLIGSPKAGGVGLANNVEQQSPEGLAYGAGMASAGVAAVPVSQQVSGPGMILDFHNSVAPYILIALLLLYGWIHVSVSARAGRAKAGAFLG